MDKIVDVCLTKAHKSFCVSDVDPHWLYCGSGSTSLKKICHTKLTWKYKTCFRVFLLNKSLILIRYFFSRYRYFLAHFRRFFTSWIRFRMEVSHSADPYRRHCCALASGNIKRRRPPSSRAWPSTIIVILFLAVCRQ